MTPSISPGGKARCQQISAKIPGYSGMLQYCFFEWLLRHAFIKDLLMIGVYHGRDLAFVEDILKRLHPGRKVTLTGVDRFTAEPCADWPKDSLKMTWEQAGMGKPPNYEDAVANCPGSTIIKAHDEDFFKATRDKFNCVYLDSPHDYETVSRQLRQVPSVCRKGAIVCGDDFVKAPNWGVVEAVRDGTSSCNTFGEFIWYTRVENLKTLKKS